MVRFGGHWSEWLLAGAIGGLYLCSLLTGIETLATIAGALFFLSLPTLLFGRRVKVEKNRLVLEIGWPITLLRVEIAPEEIIEVVDLERVERVLPLRYYKSVISLTLLWIGVGIMGLIRDPRWSFVWLGWIYWGLMTLLPFLFPKKAKRGFVLTIFTFGAVMAGLARWLGVKEYSLYVLMTIVIGFVYLTDLRERTVVIVTEKGTYFVSSLNESEIRGFMESLKGLVSGGWNAPAP